MYRISVPICNATVTEQSRDSYLSLLKRARAERVFLTHTNFLPLPRKKREVSKLKENLRTVDFLDREGKLVGDTVTLKAPIPAFEFVAFTVSK